MTRETQRFPYATLFVVLMVVSSCSSAGCKRNSTDLHLSADEDWADNLKYCKYSQNIVVLQLTSNEITKIKQSMFPNMPNLKRLYLGNNTISEIETDAFAKLTSLSELNLQDNKIATIAAGAFDHLTSLTTLNLKKNKLDEIPRFTVPSSIAVLDASENPIQKLRAHVLMKYPKLYILRLAKTKIEDLPDNIFAYNRDLKKLYITDGSLKTIKPDAFTGPSLTHLFLSNTKIDWFPDTGIEHLREFVIENVRSLWQIPVVSFKNLEIAKVTYEYHCCLIRSAYEDGTIGYTSSTAPTSAIVLPCVNVTTTASPVTTIPPRFPPFIPEINSTTNAKMPNNTCIDANAIPVTAPSSIAVNCTPSPNAFNPCGNLLGPHVLRAFSCVVMLFAIMGNLVKILVLLFNRRPVTIHKVLTSNLAFANLCMGLYLGSLVAIDLHSYGVYQNYARAWQYGGGCKGAGFLTIFSTELVVYTLTVITVERYFMIVHPLEREKHLSFRQIVFLLVVGWMFSLVMATLPLFGISDYEKVAICLPFEVEGGPSRAYVTFLLVTNGLAFFTVLFCYVRMYLSLGWTSPSTTKMELRVAKRMALLVFTNFACWFPIALLSLIAIYGHPLIDVNTSKFLLVFIYPINSFTNPYLYAIGTKSFQLDVLLILSKSNCLCTERIEATTNRLRSKLDMAPTNSVHLTSTNDSRPSLGSIRSNGRQKSHPSYNFMCLHRNTHQPSPMTPRASPTPNACRVVSRDSTTSDQFDNVCRRSPADVEVLVDVDIVSRHVVDLEEGYARLSEDVNPLNEDDERCNEMLLAVSSLLSEPCSERFNAQSSERKTQRESENGRVRYTSIPTVLVTSC